MQNEVESFGRKCLSPPPLPALVSNPTHPLPPPNSPPQLLGYCRFAKLSYGLLERNQTNNNNKNTEL